MISGENLRLGLLERFRGLEFSHAKLKEQFEILVEEKKNEVTADSGEVTSYSAEVTSGWVKDAPGYFGKSGRHRSVLDFMGHAVHVTSATTGEIIYWNRSAEQIYGWKHDEVLGHNFTDLLIDEEYDSLIKEILERLRSGHVWSGHFPFKKRSGEIFMAIVTQSPLYENGELVAVISVSTDASMFNNNNNNNKFEPLRLNQGRNNGPSKTRLLNLKRIQWQAPAPIASVPQIAATVSNLTSKVLSLTRGDDSSNPSSTDGQQAVPKNANVNLEKPGILAAKVLSKLRLKGGGMNEKEKDGSSCQNGATYSNVSSGEQNNSNSKECCDLHASEIEDAVEKDLKQFPSSGESNGGSSLGTSSSRRSDNDIRLTGDAEISWEDLKLGEEIGQGSFAIVYRGVWNGSDVAVKVFFRNEYLEETLLDYKKEIYIMRKLRHPNVLLFMGAVYSQDRLAIVTEILPRGSLFRTLHKTNQSLDIRKRLRMAIDVAKGMNYLHRRNPPIVHRDLKSSNLLVDKNWTVKVGDFGLSRLKNGTFLSAKSGRGTPQWMAPEVLRSDPSNEKSDVFSFGVVFWELMTVCIPWKTLNPLQVVGVVGFMDKRLDIPEQLDPQISSIIKDCWLGNPEKRPSFEEIIQRLTIIEKGTGDLIDRIRI